MAENLNKAEAPKKPSLAEAVDKLIEKKSGEKPGSAALEKGMSGVQTEVAEVMAGVEAPKEGVSERKGESGEKGDLKGGGQGASGQAAAYDFGAGPVELPSEEKMIQFVRDAIEEQIAYEWKIAKKLRGNLAGGSAQEYNTAISRIRTLNHKLHSLFEATYEFIKTLYLEYFGGKK